jgi:hypothetical protein
VVVVVVVIVMVMLVVFGFSADVFLSCFLYVCVFQKKLSSFYFTPPKKKL